MSGREYDDDQAMQGNAGHPDDDLAMHGNAVDIVEAEFVEGSGYDFPPAPGTGPAPAAPANGSPGREVALRPVWREGPAVADIVDGWVHQAQAVFLLADKIAPTEFVPEHLRNKPMAVAACIFTGRELGLGPMTSLRHVQIVKGVPSLSAEYKRARVLGSGHQFVIVERTTSRCTIRARRRGTQDWLTVTFDLEDARRAKLLKPDSAWATRPRRMLFARASSEVCDSLFSDVTNGLPTTELIQAGEFDEYAGYDEPPPGAASGDGPKRTVQRKTAPAARTPSPPDPEPATGGQGASGSAEPEPETGRSDPDPDTATINPKHPLHKKIFAQLREIGITERAMRLRTAGALGSTTVDSIDHLTISQAKAVADALDEVIDHARKQAGGDGEHLNDEQRHIAYTTLGRLVRAEEDRRAKADNYVEPDPGKESADGDPAGYGDPQPERGQADPGGDPGPAEPPMDDDQ